MKGSLRWWPTVGFGLVLASLAGCESDSSKLTRFNDQMALSNRKLASGAWEMRELILPLSRSTPVDIDSVRSSHNSMKNILAEIRKEQARDKDEMKKLPALEEFRKAYSDYLDAMEQIIEQDYTLIVRWIEVPNLPPPDKWAKIQGEMGKIQEKDRLAMSKLQEAQTKFSNDVSMRLVQSR